jgi:hypothetical protein
MTGELWLRRFTGSSRDHASPGLVLIKQGCPLRQAIDQLHLCYHALSAEEFANRIQYLPF